MSKNRGSLIVEAALVLPLVFYLLFNIIFGAFMLYDRHVLGNIVYSSLREMAANTDSNVMINNSATGGAGLVFHDEKVFAEKIYNGVNNNLIIYYLTKSKDAAGKEAYDGISGIIVPHESETSSEVQDKDSYTTITIKDADIVLTTKVKLKPDFAPVMVAALCPEEIVCRKKMRIELHINKVMTVKK